MPSVSRLGRCRAAAGAAACGLGLVVAISGCATTMQTAARLQLNDARIRASEEPLRVPAGDTSSTVSATSLAVLSGRGTFTAVVTLRNRAAQAVSDLPISVGYSDGAHVVYLNAAPGGDYFDNHIPAIAAHATLDWVDTGAGTVPEHARLFVRIGARPATSVGDIGLPVIAVTQPTAQSAATGHLTVQLTNDSSIPQYQLPIYAVASADGRVVAAQVGSLADLGGGAHAIVHLSLAGADDTGTTTVRVQAPATIFN